MLTGGRATLTTHRILYAGRSSRSQTNVCMHLKGQFGYKHATIILVLVRAYTNCSSGTRLHRSTSTTDSSTLVTLLFVYFVYAFFGVTYPCTRGLAHTALHYTLGACDEESHFEQSQCPTSNHPLMSGKIREGQKRPGGTSAQLCVQVFTTC